ncbi:MAG: 2-oxoacid:acceptor oxidoreductase family protein, partial [Hydrogenoanaerobacterium sp.]
YFEYDSKKSGGITISHLRFGHTPIRSTYYINKANFVACHNPSYIGKYDMVEDLKDGGTFLLNCGWDMDEINARMPGKDKRYLAQHNIKFYTLDGVKAGKELGLGTRINTVLQAAFFKLANIIPQEDAIKYMKDAATASYGKKGEKVVAMNHAAIDMGAGAVNEIKIPDDWKNAPDSPAAPKAVGSRKDLIDFVNNIETPVNA